VDARVLEARINPDFNQGRGYHPNRAAGLPHFAKSRLETAYPLGSASFEDESFPLEVSLKAFIPFIPLIADDSGIPAILFRYKVRNPGGKAARVTIAATMPNISGFKGFGCFDNYFENLR
jgi:uncharacterized protein (DUF608 family)